MQASLLSHPLSHPIYHSQSSPHSCPMSTNTTLVPLSESLGPSSTRETSHSQRCESYAPRSISGHTSPTRTSSSHPSPNKSWHQSYSSFQTSARSQCPHVHYHPWCDNCQTLTAWGPLLPTNPTCKTPILTFGDLKKVMWEKSRCQSLSKKSNASQTALQKVCSTWRDDQLRRAIMRHCAKLAAREAVRRSVHPQRTGRGATPRVT